MKPEQIKKYIESLENIVTDNIDSAKDNALRYVTEGDQIALKEAISCHTASECYQKSLDLFNEIAGNTTNG